LRAARVERALQRSGCHGHVGPMQIGENPQGRRATKDAGCVKGNACGRVCSPTLVAKLDRPAEPERPARGLPTADHVEVLNRSRLPGMISAVSFGAGDHKRVRISGDGTRDRGVCRCARVPARGRLPPGPGNARGPVRLLGSGTRFRDKRGCHPDPVGAGDARGG